MRRLALYTALALLCLSCGTRRTATRVPDDGGASYRGEELYGSKDKKNNGGKGLPPKLALSIEREARSWLGTKYRYGGKERSGTDCSGMVMVVFEKAADVKLPRDSRSQQAWCKPLRRSELAKGDLVFFASKSGGSRVSHVGIYLGDGDFIHASSSRGVIISNLSQDYYARHFHSAGRVGALEKDLKGSKAEKEENIMKEEVPEISLDDFLAQTTPAPEIIEAPLPAQRPSQHIRRKVFEIVECDSDSIALPAPQQTTSADTLRAPADDADSIRAEVRRAMSF